MTQQSIIKLPQGWASVPLGEIAVWGAGGTPKRSEPSYYDGDIPWVKTGDLGPRRLKHASEYITELGVKNSSAKLFNRGAVAIAMYGATIGKTSILDFDATTNQACAVGQPIKEVTETDFLYYLLKNEKQNFIDKGKGGAQPNISQQTIKEHYIGLPPPTEQKRIVEKLDSLLAQVETIQQRLNNLPDIIKRFRQSVLAAAVSGKLTEQWREKQGDILKEQDFVLVKFRDKELPKLPSAWSWERFDQVACIKSNLVDPLLTPKDVHIAPNHIKANEGKLLEFATVEEDGVKSNKHRFYPGQILYSKIRPYLCKVVIVDFEGVCSADMYPVETELATKFMFYWMLSFQFTEWASNGDSRTVLPKINQKQLSEIPTPVPPREEQTEIVRLVEQYFALADTLEKHLADAKARVDNLTQSILAKAFRGELVPQDPNDEPADKLLERIKAARLEAEKLEKAAKKATKVKR